MLHGGHKSETNNYSNNLVYEMIQLINNVENDKDRRVTSIMQVISLQLYIF